MGRRQKGPPEGDHFAPFAEQLAYYVPNGGERTQQELEHSSQCAHGVRTVMWDGWLFDLMLDFFFRFVVAGSISVIV